MTQVRRVASLHPHWALAVGAALVVLLDVGRVRVGPDYRWLFAEAAVAGLALLAAWRGQDRLRLLPLVAIALAFHAALVGYHLAEGVAADLDISVFAAQGNALLDGHYPRSEYPTSAVSLFGLEAWLGGNSVRTANALLMIPFQLVTVVAVWALRTRWSAWLAALVAFWPLNAFAWEYRFDLAPAALLAIGLALAYRERFGLAGAVIGLGAAVKWTPALAAAALVVWLLASARAREGVRHAAGFVAAFAVFTVPFLVWNPDNVVAAYTIQGGRTIMGESLPYLPLHWLGLATVQEDYTHAANVPRWADPTATVIQLLLVLATLALAARVRGNRSAGVAVAALVPVVFILTNRVFSPQFLVLLLVAWAIAIGLLARSRREQLLLGALAAGASFCNAFVHPYVLPGPSSMWEVSSALLFGLSAILTVWLLAAAVNARSTGRYASPS